VIFLFGKRLIRPAIPQAEGFSFPPKNYSFQRKEKGGRDGRSDNVFQEFKIPLKICFLFSIFIIAIKPLQEKKT